MTTSIPTPTERDEARAESLAARLDAPFKNRRLDAGVILREDRTILVIGVLPSGRTVYQSQHHIDDNMSTVFAQARRGMNAASDAAAAAK